MSTENIKEIVKDIDGWFTDNEGELVYNFARNCKGKGVIVEIGSWKGKSTIWLGNGSKDGDKIKIYSIDPHIGSSEHHKNDKKIWTFEEFKKNIKYAKVDDMIIPLIKTSEDAAKSFDKPVEFIFIDGAHEYESVKLDMKLWFPKIINGGIIAFHDTINFSGPKKLVKESVFKSTVFRNVGFVDSITYGQKVERNTFKDRIRNRYMLLLKHLSEFRWSLRKLYFDTKSSLPKPIKNIWKNIFR
jgi:predicted O-methyltransferase YrrM